MIQKGQMMTVGGEFQLEAGGHCIQQFAGRLIPFCLTLKVIYDHKTCDSK